MNELHLVLLLVGAVLLVALVVYNKWQERQAIKRLDTSLRQGVGDALLGEAQASTVAGRIEPRLDPASAQGVAAASPASDGTDLAAPPGAPHADGWSEDPLLDFVLELRCSHAFDGVAALEARAQLDRLALPLPTHLAVWDPKAQHWTSPDRFGFYSELLASVQMATRRQVLGEIEASRFVSAVQQIALAIDADFDPPEMARLVAQAAELDALAARFDVQITLTLESQGGPLDGAVVAAAADDAGFDLRVPGRWEKRDGHGRLLLTLTSTSLLADRLTLTLDVPLAPGDRGALAGLFIAAHQLAARLNARIVDDNGRALDAAAQSTIGDELEKLYDEMRAAGVEPGGPRAQRLYAVA
jgi:multidrug efflux pump subunit AcrA (membrane-fusion protein)